MLFRKVGAEKEEGRPKEDSLSETLRALKVAGLGRAKHRMPTGYFRLVSKREKKEKKKKTRKINIATKGKGSSGVRLHRKYETTQRNSWAVRNSDRKRVMLLLAEVGEPPQGSKCSK